MALVLRGPKSTHHLTVVRPAYYRAPQGLIRRFLKLQQNYMRGRPVPSKSSRSFKAMPYPDFSIPCLLGFCQPDFIIATHTIPALTSLVPVLQKFVCVLWFPTRALNLLKVASRAGCTWKMSNKCCLVQHYNLSPFSLQATKNPF
jgi:hypothetical protein